MLGLKSKKAKEKHGRPGEDDKVLLPEILSTDGQSKGMMNILQNNHDVSAGSD